MENTALQENDKGTAHSFLPKISAFPGLGDWLTELIITLDVAEDGRHIALLDDYLPGCNALGETQEEAITNVRALALEIIADNVKHGEMEV
jgi:predicted RNase H-like HicB family nuclease